MKKIGKNILRSKTPKLNLQSLSRWEESWDYETGDRFKLNPEMISVDNPNDYDLIYTVTWISDDSGAIEGIVGGMMSDGETITIEGDKLHYILKEVK